MILEGILTTEAADGRMHVAPIGPHVDRSLQNWILKPFKSSTTFQNLYRNHRGVFHVVDDGLLLVQALLGLCNEVQSQPQARFEEGVGWILQDACRAMPLKVFQWDIEQERAVADCEAGSFLEIRPFWGWNRAVHSLVELSILWSRRHMIPSEELLKEFRAHRIVIQKTAGDRELQALSLLESAL